MKDQPSTKMRLTQPVMCKEEPETIDHFMIRCSALEEARQPILKRILQCAEYLMRSHIDSKIGQTKKKKRL